jgi:DNA-binding response OmpR family regulator
MAETPRILIAEADILIRHPLAEYLRECGYHVAEARDAREAQALLDATEVPIDIVLASGAAGLRLTKWVRANHPRVQMIVAGTVARATEKAGELCEDGPALTMPYEHKFVLERIRRLLAAREAAG